MLPCIIKDRGHSVVEGYLTEGAYVLSDSGLLMIGARLIEIGDRLRFVRDTDVGFTIAALGETGIVDYVGRSLGDVNLVLDTFHKELAAYGNSIVLLPLVTTELLQALEVVE